MIYEKSDTFLEDTKQTKAGWQGRESPRGKPICVTPHPTVEWLISIEMLEKMEEVTIVFVFMMINVRGKVFHDKCLILLAMGINEDGIILI